MYSALKKNGKPLYYWARKGISLKRAPRSIEVRDINLKPIKKVEEIELEISCSKGTYIRVLGQDIADKLGTVGYLVRLIRVKVGKFQINDSSTIEKFESVWMSTVH